MVVIVDHHTTQVRGNSHNYDRSIIREMSVQANTGAGRVIKQTQI